MLMEPPPLTQDQIAMHNSLFSKGWRLTEGELHLDGKDLAKPNWFSRRRLNKARGLFLRTIDINTTNWQAMLAIGKIEQRLGNKEAALQWFLKAREFEPVNTSLAKEASLTASSLGDYEMATRIAEEAIENNPDDPALRVNSGLANILAGNCDTALRRFREAAALEPSRAVNSQLVSYVTKIIAGQVPKPEKESDIIDSIKSAS